MGLFGAKTPEKRYKKAVKRLTGHIIDESINPLAHTPIMESFRDNAAAEAAAAWLEMNPATAVSEESLRQSAAEDIFVHPWALKNSAHYNHALDMIPICQEAFVQAGLRQAQGNP